MFDFSMGKLLILALIALLVLGPDKLPEAARTVGALIRRVRRSWDSVRDEVERELEIEEIRRTAREAAAEAEAAQAKARDTASQLQSELDKVRKQNLDDSLDTSAGTERHASAPDTPGPVTREARDKDREAG